MIYLHVTVVTIVEAQVLKIINKWFPAQTFFQFQWASAVHVGLLSHFHAILEKNSGVVNCYCY